MKKYFGFSNLLKILFGLVLVYLSYKMYFVEGRPFFFIDNINLVFHEAGHSILFWAGDTMSIFGGTLLESLIPFLLALFFLNKYYRLSSSVMFWWLGTTLYGISLYIGDAVSRQLPLLGGEAATHDWAFLLGKYGLLDRVDLIAGIVQFVAFIYILGSLIYYFRSVAFYGEREKYFD